MDPIAGLLTDYPFIIKDGGLATEIERMGYSLKDVLWSSRMLLDDPLLIRQVHLDYLEAGADCILTSSYQATLPGFIKMGLSPEKAAGMIRLSANLALEARKEFWSVEGNRAGRPYPLVAGSAGCYGAFLANGAEYRGDYRLSEREYRDFHAPRVELLLEAGCDFIAFETVPRLDEALALARLMESLAPASAWIAFSAADGARISDGTSYADCIAALGGFRSIAAAGINCTDPLFIEPLLRSAPGARPLQVVYPNSGEVYDIACQCWRGNATGRNFRDMAASWFKAGARVIGGCCRTGPEETRGLVALRKELMNA